MGTRVAGLTGVGLLGAVPGVRRGIPLIECREAPADALERLHALALEPHEHARGVGVRALADLLGLRLALLDDLLRAQLGGARQLPLLDQERRLLLGAGEDPLGLLLG